MSRSLAFGLRELVVTDADGLNPVALSPAVRLRLAPRLAAEEFFAEGLLVAARTRQVLADWEMEGGGISLEALALMLGETVDSVGNVHTIDIGPQALPYFRIYGRSLGDAGDDIHCRILRAKVRSWEGTWQHGQYIVTFLAGEAVGVDSGAAYEFVINQEATPL